MASKNPRPRVPVPSDALVKWAAVISAATALITLVGKLL
jgi:hypothetical protein